MIPCCCTNCLLWKDTFTRADNSDVNVGAPVTYAGQLAKWSIANNRLLNDPAQGTPVTIETASSVPANFEHLGKVTSTFFCADEFAVTFIGKTASESLTARLTNLAADGVSDGLRLILKGQSGATLCDATIAPPSPGENWKRRTHTFTLCWNVDGRVVAHHSQSGRRVGVTNNIVFPDASVGLTFESSAAVSLEVSLFQLEMAKSETHLDHTEKCPLCSAGSGFGCNPRLIASKTLACVDNTTPETWDLTPYQGEGVGQNVGGGLWYLWNESYCDTGPVASGTIDCKGVLEDLPDSITFGGTCPLPQQQEYGEPDQMALRECCVVSGDTVCNGPCD